MNWFGIIFSGLFNDVFRISGYTRMPSTFRVY